MDLTFLFKLGSSGTGGCPALYETGEGNFVVQGYTLSADAAGQMRQVAPNESGVEIPAELFDQIVDEGMRRRGLL